MSKWTLTPRQALILQVGAALVLGTAAFLLSRHLLSQEKAHLLRELSLQGSPPMSIIVAAQDLAIDTVLDQQTLAVVETDVTFLPDDVVPPEAFAAVAGLQLKQPLAAGKPLLQSYLKSPISERLADLIQPGQRAVTLEVDTRSSVEGMIRVGDHLDLLVRHGSGGQKRLSVLAEAVPVIATGSLRGANPQDLHHTTAEAEFDGAYGTLTLVMESDLAVQAMLAREQGELVMLLRGSDDQEPLILDEGGGASGQASGVPQFFSNVRLEGHQLIAGGLDIVRNQPLELHRLKQRLERRRAAAESATHAGEVAR